VTERDARTHAHYLLARAAENAAAAQRCLDSQRWSAAAAAAIRAGKSAADALAVALVGRTVTHLAAVSAADDLQKVLSGDRESVFAMLALYELMGSEAGVCRGHAPATEDVARALMSHAQTLIEVARRRV
jgi:hypothetical protein